MQLTIEVKLVPTFAQQHLLMQTFKEFIAAVFSLNLSKTTLSYLYFDFFQIYIKNTRYLLYPCFLYHTDLNEL